MRAGKSFVHTRSFSPSLHLVLFCSWQVDEEREAIISQIEKVAAESVSSGASAKWFAEADPMVAKVSPPTSYSRPCKVPVAGAFVCHGIGL